MTERTSFKGLYDYTDHLALNYREARDTKTELIYLTLLVEYYECLKKSPRLKDQTAYAKAMIYQINKPYAQGYFRTPKKWK